MAKASTAGLMGEYTLATTFKTGSTVSAYSRNQMAASMKEAGEMENKKALENTKTQKVKPNMGNTKAAN